MVVSLKQWVNIIGPLKYELLNRQELYEYRWGSDTKYLTLQILVVSLFTIWKLKQILLSAQRVHFGVTTEGIIPLRSM
jgi:hypothetical protein